MSITKPNTKSYRSIMYRVRTAISVVSLSKNPYAVADAITNFCFSVIHQYWAIHQPLGLDRTQVVYYHCRAYIPWEISIIIGKVELTSIHLGLQLSSRSFLYVEPLRRVRV